MSEVSRVRISWWPMMATAVLIATSVLIAQQGKPVDDAALRASGVTGEEWLTYGLDLGEKRFSPLTQINTSTVSRLGLAWSYDIPGTLGNPPGGGNQEATPLMWNGSPSSPIDFSPRARLASIPRRVGSASA